METITGQAGVNQPVESQLSEWVPCGQCLPKHPWAAWGLLFRRVPQGGVPSVSAHEKQVAVWL